MVGWSKDLSDEQIWKLIAYIRSLYEGDPDKIIW
jgi:mono/diheme cytochrome c family protein